MELHKIYILDDTESIARMLHLAVRREVAGYTLAFTSTHDFMAVVRNVPPSLIIIDQDLDHGHKGFQVAAEVRKLSPEVIVIGMSGDLDHESWATVKPRRLFTKPFDLDAVVEEVRLALS